VFVSAQSFAAELATEGNVTRIMIGGGYGLTGNSKKGYDRQMGLLGSEFVADMVASMPAITRENAMNPEVHRAIFEVEIIYERTTCFAERAAMGVGWEWDFFDLPGSQRPSPSVHMAVDSPTLHSGLNICDDDFRSPPAGPVCDNDKDTAFGNRVMLKGLKSRPELNGSTGRCGSLSIWKMNLAILTLHDVR
jgi:hypothetical protein